MSFLHKIKDRDIQMAISKVLRYGVYIALLFASIGGIIYLYRHGNEPVGTHYQTFAENDQTFGHFLEDMFTGIAGGHGRAWISLGIIVLLATPTARILFSLLGYILEKDRMYIVITLVVLCIIGVSILGGWG